MEKRPFVNIPWYDCLINYVPEPIKKYLVVLKTKLWVFLKPTQTTCQQRDCRWKGAENTKNKKKNIK